MSDLPIVRSYPPGDIFRNWLIRRILPVCEDYDFWLRLLLLQTPELVDQKLVIKHGGHPGQLSTPTWGMDRFRVKSMEKLLSNPKLSYKRRHEVWKALCEKCEILENGFAKRNKPKETK